MDMHDLSFKMGVKNIDVWKEQDHFSGIALRDSRMTNDVSHLPAVGVQGQETAWGGLCLQCPS